MPRESGLFLFRAVAANCLTRSWPFRQRVRIAADALHVAREVAGVIADSLQRLQSKRSLKGDTHLPRIFHCARHQPPQPRRVFLIELLVLRDHLSRHRDIQSIERLERRAQQGNRQTAEMANVA